VLAGLSFTFIVLINFTAYQTGGGSGLSLSFNHTVWLGCLVVLTISAAIISFKCRLKLSKSIKYYSLCLLTLLLPLVFHKQDFQYESMLTVAGIIIAALLFLTIEQFASKNFSYRLLQVLFLSSLLQSIWGLVQYYFIYEPGLLFFAADRGQPHGTFAQKNVFASYLALGSLLALYFLFTAKNKTKPLVIFTFIVVVLNAHLTMLAEAKTGRVVPIIAVCLYLGYCAYAYQSKKLVLGLMVACLTSSFMPKQWFDVRPNQIVDAPIGIESLGLRPLMYGIGIEIVSDNLLTGIGPGNLPREFKLRKAALDERRGSASKQLQITSHIHNDPLQWMIDLGIVSGFAFLGFFITWIVGLKNGWLEPSILLLALPFVGHSLLELPFYHSAPHLLVFAIILALASKGKKRVIRFSPVLSGVTIPLASIAAYKAIAFLLLSFASMQTLVQYRMGGEQDESLLYSVEPTPTFEKFFTHEKYEWAFKRGMQEGSISKEQVFGFIDFLEYNRMRWPEALLYIQLAEMYRVSGQQQKAAEIMEEARVFFPKDEKVIAYFAKRN
jgi:O-antigen polymerase